MDNYIAYVNVCADDIETRYVPYHVDIILCQNNRRVFTFRHSLDDFSYEDTKLILKSLMGMEAGGNITSHLTEGYVQIEAGTDIITYTSEYGPYLNSTIVKVNNSLIDAYKRIITEYLEFDEEFGTSGEDDDDDVDDSQHE